MNPPANARSLLFSAPYAKIPVGSDIPDVAIRAAMSLEEEYSTEIPTDELENLTTIQSVIDYLGAKGIA